MKLLAISFMFAIVLVGCTSSTTEPYPSDRGIPYPSDKGTSIQSPSAFPSVIPTPLANTGTIVGRIVSDSGSPAGLTLCLATLLPLTPGPSYLITMDLQHSPKTSVLADGEFIITNTTPGKYVLVLWTPHDSRFIPDPHNPEKELIVTIVAGQIVDIGEVKASLPR